MSKYVRKYYLHRILKAKGIKIKLTETNKTIYLKPEQITDATAPHLKELANKHNYGIQFLNPLEYDTTNHQTTTAEENTTARV